MKLSAITTLFLALCIFANAETANLRNGRRLKSDKATKSPSEKGDKSPKTPKDKPKIE